MKYTHDELATIAAACDSNPGEGARAIAQTLLRVDALGGRTFYSIYNAVRRHLNPEKMREYGRTSADRKSNATRSASGRRRASTSSRGPRGIGGAAMSRTS